jgi:hypothetical protein
VRELPEECVCALASRPIRGASGTSPKISLDQNREKVAA